MKVEKRLSYGFKGIWGKVYKLYTFDETINSVIEYQGKQYLVITNDVQFKELEDNAMKTDGQPVANLVTSGETKSVETTDAYFNHNTKQYDCVVDEDDIIKVLGSYWVVNSVKEISVFVPMKHSKFIISMTKIFDNVIEKEY